MDERAWRRTQSANCIGGVQQQRAGEKSVEIGPVGQLEVTNPPPTYYFENDPWMAARPLLTIKRNHGRISLALRSRCNFRLESTSPRFLPLPVSRFVFTRVNPSTFLLDSLPFLSLSFLSLLFEYARFSIDFASSFLLFLSLVFFSIFKLAPLQMVPAISC